MPATHESIRESLAAYCLGTLSPEERAAVAAHLNDCGECMEELAALRQLDRQLGELTDEMPDGGLEERVCAGFERRTRTRRLVFPVARRVGVGLAATLALAATGYMAHVAVTGGYLSSPLTDRMVATADRPIAPPTAPVSTVAANGMVQGYGLVPSQSAIADLVQRQSGARAGGGGNGVEIRAAIDQLARAGGGERDAQSKDDYRRWAGIKEVQDQQAGQRPLIDARKAAEPQSGVQVHAGDRPDLTRMRQAPSAGVAKSGDATKRADGGYTIQGVVYGAAGPQRTGVFSDQRDKAKGQTASAGDARVYEGLDVKEANRAALVALSDEVAAPAGNKPADQDQLAQVPAAVPAAAPPPAAPANPPVQLDTRKIIRTGTMDFEVVSFDDATRIIASVVTEEGGYIADSQSTRLDNGKMRGTITLRVPPEHLDNVVNKLRSLGDLKGQNITAQDVSKQYIDTASELRALRAMEERLIDIIKNGKGEVKDLVVAEKQLGEYRVKIEKLEGELRWLDNQVGLSTLTVTCSEKDIRQSAAITETEQVTAALQTPDVDKAFAAMQKIVSDAKGRIVQAQVRQLEAGQRMATLACLVPAEQTDLVVAQLRGLGDVSRLERQKQQTTPDGPPQPGAKVKTDDTRIALTILNLAAIAPRQSDVLTVAVPDVAKAYGTLLRECADDAQAPLPPRVLNSSLTGNTPDEARASFAAQLPTALSDKVLAELRHEGAVVASTVTYAADDANTTTAKRGLQLTLVSLASVPPELSRQIAAEAGDVSAALDQLREAVRSANGRELSYSLQQPSGSPATGMFGFDVPSAKAGDVLAKLHAVAGKQLYSNVQQNPDAPRGGFATQRFSVTLSSPSAIVPSDSGIWPTVRRALAASAAGLLWSLYWVVTGALFVLPWALIGWGVWRLVRRRKGPTPA